MNEVIVANCIKRFTKVSIHYIHLKKLKDLLPKNKLNSLQLISLGQNLLIQVLCLWIQIPIEIGSYISVSSETFLKTYEHFQICIKKLSLFKNSIRYILDMYKGAASLLLLCYTYINKPVLQKVMFFLCRQQEKLSLPKFIIYF